MATKRKGLGRGLDALLGPATERVTPGTVSDHELTRLPVESLQRGRYQPRSDIRKDTLQELADSIRAQGVVQPIVVRALEHPEAGGPPYEIIAGERRWRAAQLAGLSEIPALIREVSDDAAVAMSLIENIQREDLNPMEEARALHRLIEEFDLTHQKAAEAVGRSRAAVSNLLRLLDLSLDVQNRVEARELEMGHARALRALDDRQRQSDAAKLVVARKLSVRQTEQLVKKLQSGKKSPAKAAAAIVDPDVLRLEKDLGDKLGAKVHLQHNSKGKGKLVVSYNSLDELEGIIEHIKK